MLQDHGESTSVLDKLVPFFIGVGASFAASGF